MSENNNVPPHSAAPSRTKLRLLCERLVEEAQEKGVTAVALSVTCENRRYVGVKEEDSATSLQRSANVPSAKYSPRWRWVASALVLIMAMFSSPTDSLARLRDEFVGSKCLVRNNYFVMEATRPRADCARLCVGVREAVELSANLTRAAFERWAYLSRPLVVRQAAAHWPALERFSVAFFRSLYDSVEGAYDSVSEECQFLPFRSEFVDLRHALAMHPARAARKPGTRPWYFGWSNCAPGVSAILRQLAPRPHFLPVGSESSALDWIFMGGDGSGAAWHLDYVQRPSWQAQISGTKSWHFRPVPECQDVCESFGVTVNKGDIIFVDTNQWYHMTHIHDGELSITIGSEYD